MVEKLCVLVNTLEIIKWKRKEMQLELFVFIIVFIIVANNLYILICAKNPSLIRKRVKERLALFNQLWIK